MLDPSIIQPASSMTLRSDGSAVYLARGLDVGGDDTNQLVARSAGGTAAFASPFPSGFGQYVSSNNLYLSSTDAAGNLLVVREPNPNGVSFLAPGANPASAVIEPLDDQVTQVDLAPSGEAAAILSEGSTAGVSFREAGPSGRFDALRPLDLAGNDRSYGIGITLDPDGGVFVVYRTEQAESVLQAYAPPGEDFGAPQQIDVPAGSSDANEPFYTQSTNGRGILVWSEDVVGNSNRDQVWAVTRAPGGLLGPKTLVAEAANTSRLVTASSAGITDSGAQYVGVLDAVPVSPCNPNRDLDRQGVIAVRGGGSGSWTLLREQGTWPDTSSIAEISTAGDAVGVVIQKEHDIGARCALTDPATRLDVRLGTGGGLGGAVTVASESITTDANGNAVGADGFAVNAGGSAILLSEEPQGSSTWKRFLYFHQAGGGPSGPGPKTEPLPAPGKIKLSGKKLVARGGEIPFEASCTRLGPGDKVYCRIDAILLEQVKRDAAARGSAAKPKKGRKKAPKKPKVLARSKRTKVPAGKTGTVKLKLNKVGAKKLKKAGSIPVTLQVTIRKTGAKTLTINRKVTLKAGKPKKKPAKGKSKRK